MSTSSLITQNRLTGKAWDLSDFVQSVSYETHQKSAPGKLEFTYNSCPGVDIQLGDVVKFSVQDRGKVTDVFLGYVFAQPINRWGEITITAYDQLRYLKNHQSYVFTNMTVKDIITKIAGDFRLRVGDMEDIQHVVGTNVQQHTGAASKTQAGPYKLTKIYHDKALFDIITDAIEQTIVNTGLVYTFFDDNGKLTVREAKKMTVMDDAGNAIVLGDGSLLTEFSYKEDIDGETYNVVKLVRPNKDTGHGDTYVAKDGTGRPKGSKEDGDHIKQWGILQFYQVVDEGMNLAQIKQQAETQLNNHNMIQRTLSLDALGIVGVRAGSMIYVDITSLGARNPKGFMLIDRAKHTWTNDDHQMQLDMRLLP